jgi:hypothetical protein
MNMEPKHLHVLNIYNIIIREYAYTDENTLHGQRDVYSLHNPSAILPITRAYIDNRTLTSAHVSRSIDSRSSINRDDFLFRMLSSDASSSLLHVYMFY